MRKNKKSNSGVIRDLYYDSLEERYFFEWCFELKDRGYIKDIKRADAFHLSDKVHNNYSKQLKTKSKPMTQTLLEGHVYTPECVITWSKKGVDLFVWDINSHLKRDKLFTGYSNHGEDLKSVVEIKPLFDYQNMQRLATLNIKWVYQKYAILVDVIKCPILFEKTFTPKAYLKTPTGKTRKKPKWRVILVEEYLKTVNARKTLPKQKTVK